MFECGDGNRLQTWWWGIQTKSTKREAAECWHPNTTKDNQVESLEGGAERFPRLVRQSQRKGKLKV
jgi:hypothetical protein